MAGGWVFRPRRWNILLAALCLVAPAGQALTEPSSPTANFDLEVRPFHNWRSAKHGPVMRFVYRHPERNLRVQGVVNRVEANYNPTPELGADTLAKGYVRNTRQNMPTFQASDLGTVQGRDLDFRVVSRQGPQRAMLCGFAVRGNTTVIVSLIGVGKDKNLVDRYEPMFRKYLSESRLSVASQ